jgi:uncharacterized damage-inducible protein DinB
VITEKYNAETQSRERSEVNPTSEVSINHNRIFPKIIYIPKNDQLSLNSLMETHHRTFDRSQLINAPYQKLYIDRVPTEELLNEMEIQINHARHFYTAVPKERLDYRYAMGKWTLRDTVQHVMDWERIFAARAVVIARGAKGPLSGYDQDDMADNSAANTRELDDILVEWAHIRRSTIGLFRTFDDQMLSRKVEIGGNMQNVLAIGFMIVGHEMHHRHVYADRYLNEV